MPLCGEGNRSQASQAHLHMRGAERRGGCTTTESHREPGQQSEPLEPTPQPAGGPQARMDTYVELPSDSSRTDLLSRQVPDSPQSWCYQNTGS